ncbi:MAG: hypothetical protein KME54_02355 [Tolypothrix brevis GSE-NOS-MK-07-07A]|jgi:hypothetical protein|nr:hypothetical protein [Tolypothrix brevis GSE-NOS-MK-07-07A]
MTLSALQKFFLPSIVSAVTVFSAMSFPLATLGDKQTVVKFEQETIFDGKLRDVATPYVVLATAMSVGTGIFVIAVCGWQYHTRKSEEFQQELSGLEKHLEVKEAQLQEFKLSESRLQVSGLTSFLDDEVPFQQTGNSKSLSATVTQPVVTQPVVTQPVVTKPVVTKPPASYEQSVNTVRRIATRQTTPTARTVTAASGFASAQTFLGYAQTNTNSTQEIPTPVVVDKSTPTASDFEMLQKQLREMMLQMQEMQSSLGIMSQQTNSEVKTPDKFRVSYDAPHTEEVQFL